MTRAKGHAQARSRRGRRESQLRSCPVVVLASIATTLTATAAVALLPPAQVPLLPLAQPASADPLASAQAEATQLSAQIQAEGQRLDVLSQQYDAAQQQVQTLSAQVSVIQGQITVTKQQVATSRANLRRQALDAYMNGADLGLENLFAGQSSRASLSDEYRSVAAGNISGTIDSLDAAEISLAAQQTRLQSTESQAQTAASQASAARSSAQAEEQQQQQTLGQIKGQIAVLVAQKQAAQAAAEAAAFQARQAAAAAAQAAAIRASGSSGGAGRGSVPSAAFANVPAAPGGVGAVQAAKTQLGVPYQWGGEQQGVGFDCSGLVQWAWGQAGVGLPRTAQEQYDAVVHVSLSALEPGDLLFWNDGTSSIQHVAIYVGGDEVIQAPQTGDVVSYAQIWNGGLVGAGRP